MQDSRSKCVGVDMGSIRGVDGGLGERSRAGKRCGAGGFLQPCF